MLRTKSNSRELLPTPKSREYSNKKRKRNGRKKRKINPNFIRYNSISIKGDLKAKSDLSTQELNYHLLRKEFLHAIMYHINNGVNFNVEINHKSLSNLYIDLTKEYSLNIYENDGFCTYKIQKDYNDIAGYSAELITLFEMKDSHKEVYNILCGCLNVIRNKIILYFDHYSWDYAKDIIINHEEECENEGEDIEKYDFTNSNIMEQDIINSKITIDDINNFLANDKYKELHKLFKCVISIYNHTNNITDFITHSYESSDPSVWAHFAWNLEEDDETGYWINQIANDDYNNQNENWFRVDIEQDSSFLDLYFELLNCFYNITLYSTIGKHEAI